LFRRAELVAIDRDGFEIPVEVTIWPVKTGERWRFFAFVHDITDRRESERALELKTEAVSLLQDIAVASNEARALGPALQAGVDRVCAFMSWPLGHAYVVSESDPDLLESAGVWHIDDPGRFSSFREETDTLAFFSGAGLPGRVLESGKPEWIHEVDLDVGFKRQTATRNAGLRSAFAFPLLVGADVVGVLEFFSV